VETGLIVSTVDDMWRKLDGVHKLVKGFHAIDARGESMATAAPQEKIAPSCSHCLQWNPSHGVITGCQLLEN
jgi:hypothetical protein